MYGKGIQYSKRAILWGTKTFPAFFVEERTPTRCETPGSPFSVFLPLSLRLVCYKNGNNPKTGALGIYVLCGLTACHPRRWLAATPRSVATTQIRGGSALLPGKWRVGKNFVAYYNILVNLLV